MRRENERVRRQEGMNVVPPLRSVRSDLVSILHFSDCNPIQRMPINMREYSIERVWLPRHTPSNLLKMM